MKSSKNFALGTITSYLSMIINIFINILMVPLLMNNLGTESYGVWITLSSIFGAMGIADLGIGQSVAKQISEKSDELNRTNYIKRIISTSFFTSIIISFVLLAINVIISFYIGNFMNMDSKNIQLLYIILFLNFIVNFIYSIFNNVLIGYKKIYLNNILNIIKSGLLFICTYAFLKFSSDLTILAIIYFVISVAMMLNITVILRKVIKTKYIALNYFDKVVFKQIFKPGIYFFVIQIAGLIVYNTDNIILSHFVSVGIVALYASAYKIIDIFMRLIFVVIDNLFPFISSLDGKKEYEKIRQMNFFTSKFSIGIGVFLAIMYYQYSRDIFEIWLGKNNYIGDVVIVAFCVILVINASTHNSSVYINALYKHKKIAYLSFFEGAFNLIFSLAFVRWYGAVGVAIGTCLGAVLTSMWFVPYYCCKILKIKLLSYIKNVIMRNLLFGTIFFCTVKLQKQYFGNISDLVSLILIFVIDGFIFCIFYYFIVLDNIEKNKIINYTKKILKSSIDKIGEQNA